MCISEYKLDDEQCVLPLVPNCEPLRECSKQLPQGVDPADGDYMKNLGYKLDHHPTSFVWLLVVVHCAWDLCKEEGQSQSLIGC